jgi:transcriptional antiterminator NusG
MTVEKTAVLPIRQTAYGCVHCMTGKELELAAAIRQKYPCIRATAVMQTKRYTQKGVTTLHNEVILKGYVFVEAPVDAQVYSLLFFENAISLLSYDDGEWRLCGEDAAYARWIFRYDGIIRLSRAYQIGERIRIIDGPLKDMEGHIKRIDRRNRNGQVALQIGTSVIRVWLGFELVNEFCEDVQRPAAAHRSQTQPPLFAEAQSC